MLYYCCLLLEETSRLFGYSKLTNQLVPRSKNRISILTVQENKKCILKLIYLRTIFPHNLKQRHRKTNICKNEDYPYYHIFNFRHIGNHWRSTRQRQKCNKIFRNYISYEWRVSCSKVQWKKARMCTDSSNGQSIIFPLSSIPGKISNDFLICSNRRIYM